MITANELRLGNLVKHMGFTVHVVALDEDGCNLQDGDDTASQVYSDKENVEPIPLTEEWLLKFGFEESKKAPYYSILIDEKTSLELVDPSTIDPNKYTESIWWVVLFQHDRSGVELNLEDIDSVSLKSLKHVHQLQNLYFALTGEELINSVVYTSS